MNKTLYIIFLCLIGISCIPEKSEKSDVVFFTTKNEDFNQYINQKQTPERPNLTLDKSIINNDYPIEIALYQDGKWYYNLANLGDGFGTWSFRNGIIKLFAKRTLFDMHIDIKATSQGAADVAIQFSDRFGPKILKMENQNF
ncbi:MAG: hypothetical protein EP326_08420 [Deltaproteobacteria bacterium]|nr:MAG: hypothetical protein EP326_08420 [Deltaproteobacteria bacterium]